jgi:hypothetical protein
MKSTLHPEAAASVAPETVTPERVLLDSVVARSAPPPRRVEGIAVGRLDALAEDGTPVVRIDTWDLRDLAARSLVAIDAEHLGQPVALGFEAGDPRRPIILGFMIQPAAQSIQASLEATLDGERVVLTAEREIELRCGEAAIILNADGRIDIRGTYVTSQASATQRILGGSVNLN